MECWFIQKFKDEISVIGAQVPQEHRSVSRILTRQFPFLAACNSRPGGGAKLWPTIS